ncbi:MAG: GntP family permease [Verrucomicrobiales bacterium]|jgi:GntP family gluconate:H+ symporter|nr:GntP family permease [Verrucomicrobiales bacterium]
MSPVFTVVFVSTAILAIVFLTSKLKLNAFVSLLLVSLLLAVVALPVAQVVPVLKEGFGAAMSSTGLIIIFGSVIAIALEHSGGALSIAGWLLGKTGIRRAPAALGLTGFIAGLPIFCDTGYIILSGLAKSFSAKSNINMPCIAAVLACALYSVHCLVPMHPGALAAAGTLTVNLGGFILAGTVVALPATLAAYGWIKYRTRGRGYAPARADAAESLPAGRLPSVGLALLPVVTPLLLITVATLAQILGLTNQNAAVTALHFVGQPVIALFIGGLVSLLLLGKKLTVSGLNRLFATAIEKSGPILIVIAGGGVFGGVIRETGAGRLAGEWLGALGLGLAVPFLMTFLMKTALGSSTVAIITAASFVAPMLPQLGLASDAGRLLTVLAMGAGSIMISHANDPYFWVVTQFAEIHPDVALRVYSTATLVMGLVSFACVWAASLLVL